MTEQAGASQDKSSYVIDAENAAEMARLTNQDRIITRCMGGLFPPQLDLSGIHDVLDIACGPGGWAMDVAKAYPDKQVIGIDISELMIEYASYQAKIQDLVNVHFRVMNALKPLDFPDNSFDFVNARFIALFMPRAAWPKLIQECLRVVRPGGIIRLTELEATISNSFAFEKLNHLTIQALLLSKQGFSPYGRNIAITTMLKRFLRDGGCQHIQHMPYVLDCSVGAEEYLSQYQNSMVFLKLIQPFLIKMGMTTQEEAERLYQQVLEEMKSPDYCALWYFLSAWGEKPR